MRSSNFAGNFLAALARFVAVLVLLGPFITADTVFAAPSDAAKAAYDQGEKFSKEKSLNKAAASYTKAAKARHRGAQYKLGQYYRSGWGGLKKNAPKAVEWFEKKRLSRFRP